MHTEVCEAGWAQTPTSGQCQSCTCVMLVVGQLAPAHHRLCADLQENDMYGLNLLVFDAQQDMLVTGEEPLAAVRLGGLSWPPLRHCCHSACRIKVLLHPGHLPAHVSSHVQPVPLSGTRLQTLWASGSRCRASTTT